MMPTSLTIRCQPPGHHLWKGDGQACSRSCGGGLYEMRRNVIAQVGLGLEESMEVVVEGYISWDLCNKFIGCSWDFIGFHGIL